MAEGRLIGIVIRNGLMSFLRRLANVLSALGLLVLVACPLTAQAISPTDLGVNRPDERVLDDADVFSRASRSELNARLQDLASERVDARVVTLRRLDYGLTLDGFGEELLAQWSTGFNLCSCSNRDPEQTGVDRRRSFAAIPAARGTADQYGAHHHDRAAS